ncbi:hypothetical protein [Pseudomonas sp. PSKL.D1]|nr:hypothetical protein [Pseudomonas sp. PSKL.D1]WDY57348.1 hypothetical protein PVV54_22650 [Pseudomonas sp. PSKL.D1]
MIDFTQKTPQNLPNLDLPLFDAPTDAKLPQSTANEFAGVLAS